MKVEELFNELSELPQVNAIALGGSRAGEVYDEKSDYDVYLYVSEIPSEELRRPILEKYCEYMELGNHFWEFEDNCRLKNGIDIDILYRDINAIERDLVSVVEECNAHNGYTTCIWHNVKTCKVLYDKDGGLTALKQRFNVSYPAKLKENIIKNNMKLLHDKMPAYDAQILKAVNRRDLNSISHRTAAFMESYFDIIFALNELTHPGEKRMVSLCKKECKILPADFEENIEKLFKDLYYNFDEIEGDLKRIVEELRKTL